MYIGNSYTKGLLVGLSFTVDCAKLLLIGQWARMLTIFAIHVGLLAWELFSGDLLCSQNSIFVCMMACCRYLLVWLLSVPIRRCALEHFCG